MKVGSAFTGIGAWEKSLRNLNIDFELEFFFEIDKYAAISYCAIHNESPSKNRGDITQCSGEDLADIDLLVYSPPCQAFSTAGKQKGAQDKRGVLFFDALRIIEAKKPKYAVMENVPGLLQDKFKHTFHAMMNGLNGAGYNQYMQVLNAKDFGIAQNRERVFIVSIRKDIDDDTFSFPVGKDEGMRLYHFLQPEDKIDKKYYLSDKVTTRFKRAISNNGIIGTTAPEQRTIGQRDVVFEQNCVIGALMASDYKQPKQILIEPLTCASRIRKLTPLECFRLMGFADEDFYKARQALITQCYNGKDKANSSLYKQAGNSIVVTVPMAIFRQLFKLDGYQEKAQLTLF